MLASGQTAHGRKRPLGPVAAFRHDRSARLRCHSPPAQASSLVEMVNALLRPSLDSCKGQITQEACNLILFYHNPRRYKSGKRQGKAPIALLTGKPPMEAPWWELLCQRVNPEQAVTDPRP